MANNVDKKWFQDRIRELGTSQREISRIMTGNPASLALMLMEDDLVLPGSGKTVKPRKLKLEEVPVLANLLDTTIDEIMMRLGIDIPKSAKANTVPCVGMVDETGTITDSVAGQAVDSPADVSGSTKAVIFRSLHGDHPQHGWVYYFDDPGKDRPVDADSLNKLCLVKIGEHETPRLGIVRRGLERGKFDVFNAFTNERIVGAVAVRSARPITWIKTA
jgi:hypothetical protein